MKLALGFRNKLAGNLDVVEGKYSLYPVRQQFDQLKARITAGWNVEHTPTGTHAFTSGSWTPVIGGSSGTSGQTYSAQTGLYVKAGQLVWVGFHATLSAKGTISGGVQIQGLPFSLYEAGAALGGASLMFNALATNWIVVQATLNNGGTALNVRGIAAAGTSNQTALETADIADTTTLDGALVYRTDE